MVGRGKMQAGRGKNAGSERSRDLYKVTHRRAEQ